MESLLGELELDMQALFNSDFHLDGWVVAGLLADVLHDEFFLLGNPIVISIYHYIDVVSQAYNDAIVRLKLFLDAIK